MNYDATAHRGAYGHFQSPYSDEIRLAVRQDYEAFVMTLRDISQKHGIAASTIQQWGRAGGWMMRQPHRIDPNDLLGRLLELLDGQIADLETVMKNGATEVAMLSKLVSTLDRVIALKDRTTKDEKPPSRRVIDLRARIADRLVELNRD